MLKRVCSLKRNKETASEIKGVTRYDQNLLFYEYNMTRIIFSFKTAQYSDFSEDAMQSWLPFYVLHNSKEEDDEHEASSESHVHRGIRRRPE